MPIALLSVYDKSGIVELAQTLRRAGWDIWSSGGTAAVLTAAEIPVTDIADRTGVPAMLGHRVVTLHPTVHGGILADVDEPEHVADMDRYGIEPIAMVVVNLYPFEQDPGVELIDIGGPAMVRAAAKNHAHVTVVVDPADYAVVADAVTGHGAVPLAMRRVLARRAFATTAAYDRTIADWFDRPTDGDAATTSDDTADDVLPVHLRLDLARAQSLRYGENPHQAGARYRFDGASSWWDDMVQHGGKALSYLNLYDTEAAWRLVHRFDGPASVVVKHANPCGVARGTDIADAYRRAHACDPVSAFGGIVAVNGEVTATMAEALTHVLTEVVVAPSYAEDALALLTARPNLRVLSGRPPSTSPFDVRSIDGGLLVQQPDPAAVDRTSWSVVTRAAPTDDQIEDLQFAWVVCAAVSSNAIVLAHDGQAVGVGAGQQNRVDSARIAAGRADGRAIGGVAASDAFFPFRDGLDTVAAAGVTAVIQPGGSVRDAEVIAAAEELGMAMVFTGERHFRH